MNKRSSKQWFRLANNGWAFVLPSIVLFLWLVLWPMISAVLMSLQKGKGTVVEFAGLDNYIRLFQDPVFISSTINTITYFIIQVPVMLVLALIISSILNNPRLKFRGFFRTAIFVPCVTSLVAYSLLFKSMFATDGIINQVLVSLHIVSEPIPWLLETFWAKVVIIFAITWRWTGYNMVFYLAGLQNIEYSVYEAAKIDGANGWKTFWNITVPLLKPTIIMTFIMSINGTLQLFDESVNLTNGGPANATITMSHYIYNSTFGKGVANFGYATAMSFFVFIIVAILAFINMKVGDTRD